MRPIVKRRGFNLQSVKLLAEPTPDTRPVPVEGAVWIQIAAEGVFKGHPAGDFTFDAVAFGEIVKNFRAHPSYERDEATGFGMGDVVAFDFHHASEEPASTLAVAGAPARAWALELETRNGAMGLELWALTRYLEPARTYIQQGAYKWTSVAVWPNATDPLTGADVGWYMSSIAFTNDPFIQGMAPIAAERAASMVTLDKGRLFDRLKSDVLGMPDTASMDEVMAELAKLRAATLPGATPPVGVDVEGLIHQLSNLLNLPVMTDADLVFAEVDKLMGALAATALPIPAPAPVAPQGLTAQSGRQGTTHMLKLLITLGRRVGIEVPPDADETQIAVLAARISDKLKLEADDGDIVRKGLSALLKALGVEDSEAGVSRVAEMMEASKTLTEFMPALESLQTQVVKNQEDEEDKDIEATMASRQLPEEMRDVLRAFRTGGIEFPTGVVKNAAEFAAQWRELNTALAGRKAARATFIAKFPVVAPPATAATTLPGFMTQELATVAGRSPYASPVLAAMTSNGAGVQFAAPPIVAAPPAPIMAGAPPGHGGAPRVDLSGYAGANLTMKAMSYVAEKNPTLSYDQKHAAACKLVRELKGVAA